MTIYRIYNWSALYETHETRKIKNLGWVPIPNKHGDGFAEIMDHEHGDRHFAVWILLLQVASKTIERGTLVRQVGDKLVGHDAISLARIIRIRPEIIDQAMARLVAIGWLERTKEDATVGTSPGNLPACQEKSGPELNRIELKIIERDGPTGHEDRLGNLLINLMVCDTKAQRKRWLALAEHEGGAESLQDRLSCIEWAVTTARGRDGLKVNFANDVIKHAQQWAKTPKKDQA